MVITQKPRVTVVMPLYNKEAEVRRSVQSVLTQTVSDFELIVVNDGSTDQGPEAVRKINDNRIRIFDQENAGVSAARNRGINESRSDLIAFLDADDEWKPDFIETILHLKEQYPSCSVFATNYVFREVNGKYHSPIIRGLPSHPWEGVIEDYFGVAAMSDPPLWTSAVSVNKEALHAIGLFPLGVTSGEDLLTWARLAARYEVAYSTECCSLYRKPSQPRLPDMDDIVSRELSQLLINNKGSNKIETMLKYLSLWHKMRATQFLSNGDQVNCVKELFDAIHYSKTNVKLWIYLAVAFLPKWMGKKFVNVLKPRSGSHT